MRTNIIAALIAVFLSLSVNSQTQWQRTIGGPFSDQAACIIKTSDGGFAVAGHTLSFGAGGYDMYIVKLNSSGVLQWSRTIGGSGNDYAFSIIQTADGGYAAAGYTLSFGAGTADICIIKLDASGVLQWSRTAGGTGYEYGYSIIQTIDGGYAAAGCTHSFGAGNGDFYIIKLDAGGTLQWSRTIGGVYWDNAYSIMQSADGSYVASGWAVSWEGLSLYIVKLDANGSFLWNKNIFGLEYPSRVSAIQTSDGGYAMIGHTEGEENIYIVKLDAGGTLQWSKTVGGTSFDGGYSIIQTTDGGYAAVGYTFSFGAGAADIYILKLNASGTLQWSRTIGGTGYDYAYSIVQTADGGYAAAGWTNSFGSGDTACYIVKLDASGNTCSNSSSPVSSSGSWGTTTSPTPTITMPTSIVMTPAPSTGSGGNVSPVCFVGVQPISNEIPSSFKLYQNYPNPFNPTTMIKFEIPNYSKTEIRIYDILGKEAAFLVNDELKPGAYKVNWDASDYPSGVYFYKLIAAEVTETKRMVLMK